MLSVAITWTVSPVYPPGTHTVGGVFWRGGELVLHLFFLLQHFVPNIFHICRCGQRWECQRGSVHGQWLWSFNQTQQCLSIQHLNLYNISLGEKVDVRTGRLKEDASKLLMSCICGSSIGMHCLLRWRSLSTASPASNKEKPTPASSRTQRLPLCSQPLA